MNARIECQDVEIIINCAAFSPANEEDRAIWK